MSDYLEIDGKITNSNDYSEILIDAIRAIESSIRKNENSTEREKTRFIPESYSHSGSNKFGIGEWIINTEGMAMLVSYLQSMLDEDLLKSLVVKKHKHNLECLLECLLYSAENLVMVEDRISELIQETKDDVHWCIDYTTDILLNMILNGTNTVKAKWV